jgi:hypothetical protein
VTDHDSPYMRLRRALDRRNVTEALSAASELAHVGLAEAWSSALRERAGVDAAGVLSEAQLEAVRESFRTARCEPTGLQVLKTH